MNLIKTTIYQTKSEYQSDNSVNPALLWDMIKMKVREKSIAYETAKNYKTKSRKDILYKEISGLEKELDENIALNDTQKSLLQSKLDNLRSEMEEVIEYRTKGAMLRSRTRWHNEGEKKTQNSFNILLPISRRRLRTTYLERLKWTHRIKHDAIHRNVMKTLRRFIEEDDMDFDEAAESAVAKRKFLLNRLMQKKLLPENNNDEEEVEEEAGT